MRKPIDLENPTQKIDDLSLIDPARPALSDASGVRRHEPHGRVVGDAVLWLAGVEGATLYRLAIGWIIQAHCVHRAGGASAKQGCHHHSGGREIDLPEARLVPSVPLRRWCHDVPFPGCRRPAEPPQEEIAARNRCLAVLAELQPQRALVVCQGIEKSIRRVLAGDGAARRYRPRRIIPAPGT
jgi:hypothetical protein